MRSGYVVCLKKHLMSEAAVIAKIVLVMLGAPVQGHAEGVAAYATRPHVWYDVCMHRVKHGWNDLDCNWPCLVSGIEQDSIGEKWLVDVPGVRMHTCLVVDVGQRIHLEALRKRGEIVELPYWLAMQAGLTGYTKGVRIWRLGK